MLCVLERQTARKQIVQMFPPTKSTDALPSLLWHRWMERDDTRAIRRDSLAESRNMREIYELSENSGEKSPLIRPLHAVSQIREIFHSTWNI